MDVVFLSVECGRMAHVRGRKRQCDGRRLRPSVLRER